MPQIKRRSLFATLSAQVPAAGFLWRRSLALVLTAAPQQTAALGAVMLLQSFLPVGTLWASRGVVNAAVRSFGGMGPTTNGGAALPFAAWIALAVGAIVAQQLLAPFSQAAQEAVSDRLQAHVNGELIAAVNRFRGLARFEDPSFANHLATARQQAVGGAFNLLYYGGHLVGRLFTIVAMSAALWHVQPLAPLLVILVSLPQALLQYGADQRMADRIYRQSEDGRKLHVYRNALLEEGPAKDVRLFDLGAFFLRQYDPVFLRMTATLGGLRRTLLRRMLPAIVLSGLGTAAVYLYAVRWVLDGSLSLGDLVLVGGALLGLEAALLQAGWSVGLFAQYFVWLPSLFIVLDAEPDLPLPSQPVPAPRLVRSGLVLEHVSFRYPGTATTILHDVSLTLRPGERLALVGRNGAGKTTLVKLLARLYDPTEGRILLDGVDLRDYDLAGLRRQIGVVFQDFVSYQLTAQENIGLGDVGHLEDRAHVEAAAHKGGAATLIEGLPQGYATQLGTQFGGVNLSGGQWQRIALSRACMRQAQLLILDEPTAALDVQAEYDVYLRFAELTKGAMTVLVSHRFSTVRMAEHICYLEDGRLLEEGTHDDLIVRAGGYAQLYGLQAELYRDGEMGK
ncbi:MAG: ABC transporter ATP-binding protein [Chloroflexota bacterium]